MRCLPFCLVLTALFSSPALNLSADDTFNPAPATLDSPANDPAGSTRRLNTDSGGKTLTVKNLTTDWIKALSEERKPVLRTRENSKDFDYVGMPIGGIGAGELYLSGDGRLWMWDIFNTRVQPNFPVEQGKAYIAPHVLNDANDPDQYALDQGFILRTTTGGKTATHTLDRDGFPHVTFTGHYPIGYVDYAADDCPAQVRLKAFSPFAPGSVDDSTYPATILNYTGPTHRPRRSMANSRAGWSIRGRLT